MNFFKLDLVDFNNNFELEVKGTKDIYNTDKSISASDWVREEIKGLKTFDAPQVSTALNIKQKGVGTMIKNSLGYMVNVSNSIYKNTTDVFIVNSTSSMGHGLHLIRQNFHKVVTLFTARKSITPNWMNCKDEYLAPNEQHELFEQFSYDSIIYSLFNNSSQQSSLRQVDYKDKKWDIKNEFFWLSKNDILKLSEENHYDEIYKDAKTSDERFVYTKLFNEGIYDKLSPDAKDILDTATDLLIKSFNIRKIVAENHPEYHLNAWDCGYAQLKLIWKDYFKDEFKSFRDKYKAFENRLQPLVYELGFLRK